MLQNIIFVIIGLLGLYYGGDWLVRGASRTARAFKVEPLIIGLTIVAVGTSMPELVVSLQAAARGAQGLALGNVIGSNIANIGLILGLSGIIGTLVVHKSLIEREIPILLMVTLFATALILDGNLSRVDGILLLGGYVAFNFWFYYIAQKTGDESVANLDEVDDAPPEAIDLRIELARIIAGVAGLVVGSNFMVEGAVNLAQALGVSDLIIGVTMVAFGTSLPELAASLTAVMRNEEDIAIGNVIGSNVANLLLVLGTVVFVTPFPLSDTSMSVLDYLVMLGFTAILIPFVRNHIVSRLESTLLLGGYTAFILYSFFA